MKKTHTHSPLLLTPQTAGLRPNYEKVMKCYLCSPYGKAVTREKINDDGTNKHDCFYIEVRVECHGQSDGWRFHWDSETETINDAIKAAFQHRWFDPMPSRTDAEKFYSSNATPATEGNQLVRLAGK